MQGAQQLFWTRKAIGKAHMRPRFPRSHKVWMKRSLIRSLALQKSYIMNNWVWCSVHTVDNEESHAITAATLDYYLPTIIDHVSKGRQLKKLPSIRQTLFVTPKLKVGWFFLLQLFFVTFGNEGIVFQLQVQEYVKANGGKPLNLEEWREATDLARDIGRDLMESEVIRLIFG